MRRRRIELGLAGGAAALCLLAACARQVPGAAGEPPAVVARAAVDRAVATTGDLIHYNLTVEHAAGLRVEVPEVGAGIAGFRLVNARHEPPREANGRVVERQVYELRADLVGSYILPPVTVSWQDAAGSRQTTATAEIFVEVKSVLPADGEAHDIRDLKPLRPLPRPLLRWLWALGLAVLAAAAVYAFRRWRRRPRPLPAALPPHEIAFAALAELRQTDFSDTAALRRYYFALSAVLRTYVEQRFGLNATDLTSEEILRRLGELGDLAAEDGRRLRRFLVASDAVKFAAHQPAEQEIGDTYEDALSFVESTRPRAVEASTGEPPQEVAA